MKSLNTLFATTQEGNPYGTAEHDPPTVRIPKMDRTPYAFQLALQAYADGLFGFWTAWTAWTESLFLFFPEKFWTEI
jgi:hypothetical protein